VATENQLDQVAAFLDGWEIPWNEEQLKLIASVHDPEEHAIGQAVPGSGKTTCIVSMVHYLINGCLKVSRDQILVCSFNASCAELIRQRLGRVAGMSDRQFTKLSRTYHSVGFEVCKKLGRSELAHSVQELVIDAMALHDKEFETIQYDTGVVMSIISYAKNRGAYVLTPGRLDSSVYIPEDVSKGLEVEEKIISSILRCYEKVKGQLIDFDDQIAIPYQRYAQGEENPFKHYHNLRYLLVDELQDANRAQMGMVKAIQDASGCKVIGVGDSDQAIYAFRGAVAHNVDLFQKEFKARFFPIPYNYRSGFRILDAASAIIKHNPGRTDYVLKAGRKKIRGEVVEVSTIDAALEMEAMYEVIRSLTTCPDYENGPYRYNQITIISRTNQVLGHAARYLFFKGVPVIAKMDDMKGEFNQVLNCVAACLNHPNADMRDALLSIKNVGEKRAQKMTAFGTDLDDVEVAAIGKGKIAHRVKDLIMGLRKIRKSADKVEEVYNKTAIFEKLVISVINLLELFTIDYQHHIAMTMRQDLHDAAKFIIEMAKRSGARNAIGMMYNMGDVDLTARRNDAIELMTAHRAKGQENNVVIILDGNNFPHVRTDFNSEGYHQEINLLFVAMTRAKDMLVVMRHPKSMLTEDGHVTITSSLYNKVDWDDQVRWDTGEKNQRAFKSCFPVGKKEKTNQKKLRNWEKADWPAAIKSFQTGKDFEDFKAKVAGKFDQDGCVTYLHQPPDRLFYDPENLKKIMRVLQDTAKEMMNIRAKGKSENERNEDKQRWFISGSKLLSDYMGAGWRPLIYDERSWLRSIKVQKDHIFTLAPPPGDGRTSETTLVASLVMTIAGHPRIRASLYLKISHVKFSFCRSADTVDSLLRYDMFPVTSPIGMLLWKSEIDWSKSIKPKEGFHSAIPYIIEHLPDIRPIEAEFDTMMSDPPSWIFDLKPFSFHPGGHLWVHHDPDILWPIHPPSVRLVEHMNGRTNYVFDYNAQLREQAFYGSFKFGEMVVPLSSILQHIDETKKTYRSLPVPAWEYIVAAGFNVPSAGIQSEATGKKIQFNISACPELIYPEEGFDESVSSFLKKPVRFKII
jgi:DNA helicase-2/ATP-dependent DNA helicase PcrA